jgi:hypothetical protein
MDSSGYEQRQAMAYGKTIGRILTLGVTLSIAAIIGRVFGSEVPIAGTQIPINYVCWAILGFSLAHSFSAFFFVRIMHIFWHAYDAAAGKHLFQELSLNSGAFFQGMVPRRPKKTGSHYYRISLDDPSGWLSYGSVLVVFVAALPWHLQNGSLKWSAGWFLLIQILAAIVLPLANWLVGGFWVIALSELTFEKRDGQFHTMLDRLASLWQRYRSESG